MMKHKKETNKNNQKKNLTKKEQKHLQMEIAEEWDFHQGMLS